MEMCTKPKMSVNKKLITTIVSSAAVPVWLRRAPGRRLATALLDVFSDDGVLDLLDPRLRRRLDFFPVERHEDEHDHGGHQSDDHQVFGRRLALLILHLVAE